VQAFKLAEKLVKAGLWERRGTDGFQVHDYTDWNLSAAKIREHRKQNAERQDRYRTRNPASGLFSSRDPSPDALRDASTDASHDASRSALRNTAKIRVDKIRVDKSSKPPLTPPRGDAPGFDAFWILFPNHAAKDKALKAWNKLNPNPALQSAILAAVRDQTSWPQWTKDAGQFVPHASSWLNGRRWDDQPPPAGHAPKGRVNSDWNREADPR
jgi:hypothetical protein